MHQLAVTTAPASVQEQTMRWLQPRAVLGVMVLATAALSGCAMAPRSAQPAPAPHGRAQLASAIVRHPTRAIPSQVLLIGDSIMDQAGSKAARLLADRGVTATVEGAWGSGPMPVPGQFDWVTETRRLLVTVHPTVTVIMFYGNYWPPFTHRPDGSIMQIGDADFCTTWGNRVAIMVDILRAAGSRVVIAESAPGALATRDVVFACEQAATRHKPGVTFVSAGDSITRPGTWDRVETQAACDGRDPLPLRPAGNIHLTWSGGQRMGAVLADAVLSELGQAAVGAIDAGQAVVAIAATRDGRGYRVADCAGGVIGFGPASHANPSYWRAADSDPVVAITGVPHDAGYRIVTAYGDVIAYGGASFLGSVRGGRLHQPIVGMAATQSGNGYWLVASDGTVHAFGDATFHGSVSRSDHPIVGMAVTPLGNGYWLVASDGTVFAFGDATFHGSVSRSDHPIVGMAVTPSGNGYWLVASDGTVFAFGDATFHGSADATLSLAAGGLSEDWTKPHAAVVGIAATSDGGGYWIATRDQGVLPFGDARDLGSLAGSAFISSTPPRTLVAQ
jgi:hypothetical protein